MSQSSRRFPYGYLVTTSLQSFKWSWTFFQESAKPLNFRWKSQRSWTLRVEKFSDLLNFQSVTGGEYKAQVQIHRGVLIHDY